PSASAAGSAAVASLGRAPVSLPLRVQPKVFLLERLAWVAGIPTRDSGSTRAAYSLAGLLAPGRGQPAQRPLHPPPQPIPLLRLALRVEAAHVQHTIYGLPQGRLQRRRRDRL